MITEFATVMIILIVLVFILIAVYFSSMCMYLNESFESPKDLLPTVVATEALDRATSTRIDPKEGEYGSVLRSAHSSHVFDATISTEAELNVAIASFPAFFMSNDKVTIDVQATVHQSVMDSYESANFAIFVNTIDNYMIQAKRLLWALEFMVSRLVIDFKFDFSYVMRFSSNEPIRKYKMPFYINMPNAHCSDGKCTGSMGRKEMSQDGLLPFSEQTDLNIETSCHEFFHMVQGFSYNTDNWESFWESTAAFAQTEKRIPLQQNPLVISHHKNATLYTSYDASFYINLLVHEFGNEFFGRLFTTEALHHMPVTDALVTLTNGVIADVTELFAFFCKRSLQLNTFFDDSEFVKSLEWFGYVLLPINAGASYKITVRGNAAYVRVMTCIGGKQRFVQNIELVHGSCNIKSETTGGITQFGIACAPDKYVNMPNEPPQVTVEELSGTSQSQSSIPNIDAKSSLSMRCTCLRVGTSNVKSFGR